MRTSFVTMVLAAALLLPGSLAMAQNAEQKAMAQKVAAHLKQSGQLVDYRVGVKYQDGVAWLMGQVTDAQQREMAIRLTEQVEGINQVVSKLTLSEPEKQAAEPASRKQAPPAEELVELASLENAGPAGRQAQRARTRQANRPRMSRPSPQSQQRLAPRQSPNRAAAGRGMPLPAQRIGTQLPQRPAPIQPASAASYGPQQASYGGCPGPCGPGGYVPGAGGSGAAYSYDNASMPGYAWPSYASYPNYAGLTYPQQYSPSAWPYIGPFYPYPQVPLGWRKVSLEWDDGWWFLDFSDTKLQ